MKFLAALAMPIMFAACTSEDLYTTDADASQKEAVGTKLIGTDVVLNISKNVGIESRKYTDGNWHKTDLIGMGWICYTDNMTDQSLTNHPDKDILYDNKQFFWDDEKASFTARGNFYEGWYFTYYPWTYMPKLNVYKKFEVNPEQKSNKANDRYSQLLHLSGRQFISADNVNQTTGELNKAFTNIEVLNVFGIKTSPAAGSAFEKGKCALADRDINKVTVYVGAI